MRLNQLNDLKILLSNLSNLEEILKVEDDNEISNIIKIFKKLSGRGKKEEDIMNLVRIYILNPNKTTLYKIITDEALLSKRTSEEHLKLLKLYTSTMALDQNQQHLFKILNIILNREILENRTYEEQYKLLTLYFQTKDIGIYELIIGPMSLKPFLEQMKGIEEYLENGIEIGKIIPELKSIDELVSLIKENNLYEFDIKTKVMKKDTKNG